MEKGYFLKHLIFPSPQGGEGRLEKNKAKDSQGEAGGGEVKRELNILSRPFICFQNIIQRGFCFYFMRGHGTANLSWNLIKANSSI